jgi:hypothetical protein
MVLGGARELLAGRRFPDILRDEQRPLTADAPVNDLFVPIEQAWSVFDVGGPFGHANS